MMWKGPGAVPAADRLAAEVLGGLTRRDNSIVALWVAVLNE